MTTMIGRLYTLADTYFSLRSPLRHTAYDDLCDEFSELLRGGEYEAARELLGPMRQAKEAMYDDRNRIGELMIGPGYETT